MKGRYSINTYLLIIVWILLAIPLFLIAKFWFMYFLTPPPYIPKVVSDLRTYRVALDTYHIDHGRFPYWSITNPPLTTPLNYLNQLIVDPFAEPTKDNPEGWLRYESDGKHYIAWSVGPDKISQINGLSDISNSLDALIQKQYDSSNGTESMGDIWRSNLAEDDLVETQPMLKTSSP